MDTSRTGEAVRIEPASILRIILIITAIVLALGYLREIIGALQGTPATKIAFHYLGLNKEQSLPAWWSAMLLAIGGGSMLLASVIERRGERHTWRGWRWLGIGFVYASLDEAVSLHEYFGDGLHGFADPTGGLLTFRWVIVGIAIVIVVGLLFLPFLLHLPRRTSARLIIAGAVYLGGAIGVEMLGGAASATIDSSFTYQALFMIEETLEMLGAILGIRAVLLHIDEQLGRPAFRIASAA